jgi:hypothetical protein
MYSYTQGDLCKCEVNHISHMSDFALNVQVNMSDPPAILTVSRKTSGKEIR